MSKLLEKIKHDRLQARRERDSFTAGVLTTLLGEASPSGHESFTDKGVQKVVEKFIKNAKTNIDVSEDKESEFVETAKKEIGIYERYIPQQLTEEELRKNIHTYITQYGCDNIGKIMKNLKNDWDGQFDGKVASKIAKELLND